MAAADKVASSPVEHAIDLPCAAPAAQRALAAAAEEWGAELVAGDAGAWTGQDRVLHLPVMAGLRTGLLSGPVTVTAAGGGARVTFRPVTQDYYLETLAVAVMAVAGAGALLAAAWPLFPQLLPAAPLGVVLAISGWFLVLARKQARGPGEFLASVARHAATDDAGPANQE